jgi:hypothetical protein
MQALFELLPLARAGGFPIVIERIARCEHSVAGGAPTSVVFSGPLHGGSPEEWVTTLTELRDCFQGSSFLQLDSQRGGRRVSPKTALARPPVIFQPLTSMLQLD